MAAAPTVSNTPLQADSSAPAVNSNLIQSCLQMLGTHRERAGLGRAECALRKKAVGAP